MKSKHRVENRDGRWFLADSETPLEAEVTEVREPTPTSDLTVRAQQYIWDTELVTDLPAIKRFINWHEGGHDESNETDNS